MPQRQNLSRNCGIAAALSLSMFAAGPLQAPAQTRHARGSLQETAALQADNSGPTRHEAVLPNGRRITPQGAWIPTAPYPFTLALRPDGKQLAIPSVGWPFSLNVLDVPTSRQRLFRLRTQRQIPPDQRTRPP